MTQPQQPGPAGAPPKLGAVPANKRADSVSAGLQQLFGSVADEPVPDEFMALLARIDAEELARTRSGAPGSPEPPPGDSDQGDKA